LRDKKKGENINIQLVMIMTNGKVVGEEMVLGICWKRSIATAIDLCLE